MYDQLKSLAAWRLKTKQSRESSAIHTENQLQFNFRELSFQNIIIFPHYDEKTISAKFNTVFSDITENVIFAGDIKMFIYVNFYFVWLTEAMSEKFDYKKNNTQDLFRKRSALTVGGAFVQ